MNFKNVPIVILNKWVIGIEHNECQHTFRACVNACQSSPKHMVEFMTMALGEVTFVKRQFMKLKIMGVVFVNGDAPNFKIHHGIKNYTLPINTFHSDSLKNICNNSYAPRLCEAVFQQCKPFLEHDKVNHRFGSKFESICKDLMECGLKVCIGISPFS